MGDPPAYSLLFALPSAEAWRRALSNSASSRNPGGLDGAESAAGDDALAVGTEGYAGDVTYKLEGVGYPTVEHAFQAAKTVDEDERKTIREASSPSKAKRLGRAVKLRSDWESIKIDLMRDLLRQRFADPQLAELLRATGERQLIEGNTWNDRFLGVCGGAGKNWLGRLLMEVRAELHSRTNV